jgi:hypothetical protein
MIATVAPAMISYQKVTTGKPLEAEYLERLVDSVLVPLATAAPRAADAVRATADAGVAGR